MPPNFRKRVNNNSGRHGPEEAGEVGARLGGGAASELYRGILPCVGRVVQYPLKIRIFGKVGDDLKPPVLE